MSQLYQMLTNSPIYGLNYTKDVWWKSVHWFVTYRAKRTHARTHGRTTRKHNASSAPMADGDIKRRPCPICTMFGIDWVVFAKFNLAAGLLRVKRHCMHLLPQSQHDNVDFFIDFFTYRLVYLLVVPSTMCDIPAGCSIKSKQLKIHNLTSSNIDWFPKFFH